MSERVRSQMCKRGLTTGSRLVPVVAQRQLRLLLEDMQHGGQRGGGFGKFLALSRLSLNRVRLRVPLSGGSATFARSLKCV